MQNIGTILNLSTLYQSYSCSPFFFQISRSTLSLPPKKKEQKSPATHLSESLQTNRCQGFRISQRIENEGVSKRMERKFLPLDGGWSLTCRVLILKFRVAREGVSKAWPSSPSRGEKRGEETFLAAHRPRLD